MSDLSLGPADSGSTTKYFVFALVVLTVIAAGVFYFNPRKTVELHVDSVHTYLYTGEPRLMKGAGNILVEGPGEHDLYVIANLRVDNKLRLPLFVNGIECTYTAPDGSERTARAASPNDIGRVEKIFPALKLMLTKPLDYSGTFPPQSSVEGQVMVEFPDFTNDTWNQRKSASLTVNFTHQPSATVAIP